MKRMKKLLTGLLTLAMTVVWFNIDRLGQPEELLPLIRPYFLLQLASLVFVMTAEKLSDQGSKTIRKTQTEKNGDIEGTVDK